MDSPFRFMPCSPCCGYTPCSLPETPGQCHDTGETVYLHDPGGVEAVLRLSLSPVPSSWRPAWETQTGNANHGYWSGPLTGPDGGTFRYALFGSLVVGGVEPGDYRLYRVDVTDPPGPVTPVVVEFWDVTTPGAASTCSPFSLTNGGNGTGITVDLSPGQDAVDWEPPTNVRPCKVVTFHVDVEVSKYVKPELDVKNKPDVVSINAYGCFENTPVTSAGGTSTARGYLTDYEANKNMVLAKDHAKGDGTLEVANFGFNVDVQAPMDYVIRTGNAAFRAGYRGPGTPVVIGGFQYPVSVFTVVGMTEGTADADVPAGSKVTAYYNADGLPWWPNAGLSRVEDGKVVWTAYPVEFGTYEYWTKAHITNMPCWDIPDTLHWSGDPSLLNRTDPGSAPRHLVGPLSFTYHGTFEFNFFSPDPYYIVRSTYTAKLVNVWVAEKYTEDWRPYSYYPVLAMSIGGNVSLSLVRDWGVGQAISTTYENVSIALKIKTCTPFLATGIRGQFVGGFVTTEGTVT